MGDFVYDILKFLLMRSRRQSLIELKPQAM